MIEQMNSKLWGLLLRMSAQQRQKTVIHAFESVRPLMEKHETLRTVLASLRNAGEVEPQRRKAMAALVEQFSDAAAGGYRGEPESRWTESFRMARCAQAISSWLEGGASDGVIDSVIYEIAHAHYPNVDGWLEQLAADIESCTIALGDIAPLVKMPDVAAVPVNNTNRGPSIKSWWFGLKLRWHWRRVGSKVHPGMMPAEVENVLGKPTRAWSDSGLCFWTYDCFIYDLRRYGVAVVFDNERVGQVYWRMEPCDESET